MALANSSQRGGGGSGGGVASVTAADTSVVVGGTGANPTVRTGTLDVIAADHAPAGDWSNNSHKITSLANGSAASDAAAFGQLPTSSQLIAVLFDSTLGGAAASIDTGAGGIAGGFTSLMIYLYLRSADVLNQANIKALINNDSSALYNLSRIRNANTTLTGVSVAAQTSLTLGIMPAASDTANLFGPCIVHIPFYAGAANFKCGRASSGAIPSTIANVVQDEIAFAYQSTSAITRFSVASVSGGNLVAGSRMTIYGMP